MAYKFIRRTGFTLIELLVVMLIISVLIALLIPAVNSARQAARSTQSKNNLKQISLASNLFHSSKGYFPPSSEFAKEPFGTNIDGWSILTLLLPYLEQQVIYEELDYTRNYNYYVDNQTGPPATTAPLYTLADGTTAKIGAIRVPTYISPAEPRDEVREGKHHPFNYAVNLGTWFVYDPVTGEGGNGSAYPNSRLKDGAFTDGLSNTLGFAEVKAWQPYFRNTGSSLTTLSGAIPNPAGTLTQTAAVAQLGALLGTPEAIKLTGHTEWIDGRAHHSGFTTVFRPNQKILIANSDNSVNAAGTGTIDCDWNNWQEGKNLNQTTPSTNPTFAAVTARSYFAGIVNVSMMDGSVRSIDESIHIGVWRAISTRAGKEKIPNTFNRN
jgi:prepilin-type N-terminal cleavage/methylation domain-containing protein